ncbi:hypothetical protein JNM05_11915 [bacterium]|nr:hypothetical protein [bacterium]
MKVAFVGNMNNNFFSLMRYFRDLGVDAHLLMFSDEAEHFQPEYDTWHVERWRPFIKTLDLKNTERGLIISSAGKIRRELAGYDRYVGCGTAPAYFQKAGMYLQLFVPYAYGVEFYGYHKFNLLRPLREAMFQITKYYQGRSIRNRTGYLVTCDKTPYNRSIVAKLKVKTAWMPTPIVYNKETPEKKHLSEMLKEAVAKFSRHDLVLFSHVSHKWKKIPREWKNISIKSNDVLIRGFAEFVKTGKASSPLLVLLEYGQDVVYSKELIKQLGIERFVFWLPLLSRKEIMVLLDHVDLGGAELGGLMWGGTGWEFLSKGVPFFQYLNMSKEGFMDMTDAPIPPFLNVKNEFEIRDHLVNFMLDKEKYTNIGSELKSWFDRYNGQALASKFVDLLGPD